MESIPVYPCDNCGAMGRLGLRCRACDGGHHNPPEWKTPHDLEGCAIAMMLDAQPRHPVLERYVAHVAADPEFMMDPFAFWDAYITTHPDGNLTEYLSQIGWSADCRSIWEMAPETKRQYDDLPHELWEAKRQAIMDNMAWSLAAAIVEFRQRGRIMGSYRDAYYRAYQEALDAGSVPPRNEPMCSSFAAEVAGAVARANGEIRNLLYRAAHGKAIR